MNRYDANYRGGLILAIGCVLALNGCGKPRGVLLEPSEPYRVWPAPPEAARIRYLGQFSTEADLQRGTSGFEDLGTFLFGEKSIGAMVRPFALAVDGERLYVADSTGAVIHIMDLRTREYRQISQADGIPLQIPVGLALGPGRLYVSDSAAGRVIIYDREGNFVETIGQDRLLRPTGIAWDETTQRLFVADTLQHLICIFSAEGKFEKTLGWRGYEPGQFNFPTHLWCDPAGRLYVSDALNHRVQVFSPDGAVERVIGEQGDRPGQFAHPLGVATDRHGNLYVTDKQFENVQIFNQNGQVLMAFGAEGNEPGQFWLPGGIFIDNQDRIFVADSFNKRVQVFELIEEP